MADEVVVVTGAATGIGRRAAVQLVRRGWHVVVVTRSDQRAAGVIAEARAATPRGDTAGLGDTAAHGEDADVTGAGRITGVPADLADLAQVRTAADRIAAIAPVRAIVSNAAILAVARRQPRMTTDGIEEIFAVNHVAPFVFINSLGGRMVPGGRVVIASSAGLRALPWLRLDPDDLDSRRRWSPAKAYYRSKLAQLGYTAELRRRGVEAVALQVPSVRLDPERLATYPWLMRVAYWPKTRFAADPGTVAVRYVELATGSTPEAGHVNVDGHPLRWPAGTDDPSLGAGLWRRTAALAGNGS